MLTVLIAVITFSAGFQLGSNCSPDLLAAGICTSVGNSGTQVDLSASASSGGRPGSTAPDSSGSARPPAPPAPAIECLTELCRPTYSVATIPDVTVADLVSFRPAPPTLAGEPAGFGVVGLPTNLVGASSEQRISGELLGWDVTVRFVPVGYVFDHGDGTTLRTASGGAPWSALGLPVFAPTSTSHVYRESGERTVRVTASYAASVDFGTGGWRPVGVVTADSAGYGIRVVEARTALVDRTCGEGPLGPGC